MAWARQPGAPEFPSCPLEAFEPQTYDYKSYFEQYAFPLFGGLLGFFCLPTINYFTRRPIYSGIWFNVIAGFGCVYAGLMLRDLRREISSDKDESLRQYIKLHPEDFPPYKKVLYKNVLEPWEPVR